ncbi:MAG: hypothetical protein M1469_07100 [Bacteroidetes bacterium]|nr:hypothetical protein [Bacteroidota bacterium]
MPALENQDTRPSWYLIGASQNADPSGGWYLYKISATFSEHYFADFPGLGVDASAIYVTSNQWVNASTFAYAQLFVCDKSQFYSGQSANYKVFRGNDFANADGTCAFTVKPAHKPSLVDAFTAKGKRITGGGPRRLLVRMNGIVRDRLYPRPSLIQFNRASLSMISGGNFGAESLFPLDTLLHKRKLISRLCGSY